MDQSSFRKMNPMRFWIVLFFLMSPYLLLAQEDSQLAQYQRIMDIAKTADREALSELKDMLKDSSSMIRHTAAGGIADIGGKEAEKIFSDLIVSNSIENRRIGAVGLGKVACSDGSLHLLLDALKDSSWQVRWAVCFALGLLGDDRAKEGLEKITNLDSYQSGGAYPVRKVASVAMVKIQKSVRWYGSLVDVIGKSVHENKPVLIFVSLDASDWSKKMNEEVFKMPEIIKLSREYIMLKQEPVKLQVDRADFDIQGVPTLLFLDSDLNMQYQVNGYLSAGELEEKMIENLEKKVRNEREILWHQIQRNLEIDHYTAVLEDLRALEVQTWLNDQERDLGLFYLGYCYGKLESHRIAVQYFEELIRLNPQFYMVRKAEYCLALSYLALGRVKKSKKILSRLEDDAALKEAAKYILQQISLRER